jgi:hypothetical protein
MIERNDRKRPIYIFHLYRKDKDFVLLHPFNRPEKLINFLENNEIRGRYGVEPRVETLTYLKNELYRMVDTGVDNWISDLRFIPRFLLASAGFVAAFFFLSFVIIDPIPLVDEVAGSIVAAIIIYIFLGRIDSKSDLAARRRISLKTKIDKIIFLESDFVKKLEQNLQEHESEALEEMFKRIIDPLTQEGIIHRESIVDELADEKEEARFFIIAYEATFMRHVKKDEKKLKKYIAKVTQKETTQDLKKWLEQKKIDFPLYFLYQKCKQHLVNTKL